MTKGSIYTQNMERVYVERGSLGSWRVKQKRKLWAVCPDELLADTIAAAISGSLMMLEAGVKPSDVAELILSKKKEPKSDTEPTVN